MSSISSELAALGSTTTLDLYQRIRGRDVSECGALLLSKLFTALGFEALYERKAA